MDFSQLIRPHLLSLSPYSSARDEYSGKEGIFLDANENPYGSVLNEAYNRYPDPYQFNIKEKIATLKEVQHSQIFLGNGSDEAIDLIIKAVCEPNQDNIVIMPPTYGMYKVCADIQQVFVQQAPLNENFDIDLNNVFDAVNSATKIIFICSPNNPSGNLLDQNAIFQILKAFPNKLVIVDEAYIDFDLEKSLLSELVNFENLVILQTFSKAWGMAGLRLGLAFGHENLISILNKIKYPYNINLLSQEKLLLALENVETKNSFVKQIIDEREILKHNLSKLGIALEIYPSNSNMLLVKFTNAKVIFEKLLDAKIIVRDRTNVVLCENCLRISLGTKAENEALIMKLTEIDQER